MKNYVKEYKGHKVPEGATHVSAFPTPQPIEFYRVIGGTYKFFNTGTVNPAWCKSVFNEANKWSIELPEVPQEWDGEGLPPVGCRCSATWLELPDGGCNDFCEVAIKGYFDGEVWLSKVNGVGYSEVLKVKDCEFRPIKTQQEKDREAFVGSVKQLLPKSDDDDLILAGKLFELGFTAPKAADNE